MPLSGAGGEYGIAAHADDLAIFLAQAGKQRTVQLDHTIAFVMHQHGIFNGVKGAQPLPLRVCDVLEQQQVLKGNA